MFKATQKSNSTGNITLSTFESFKKELNEFLKDEKHIKYSSFRCRKKFYYQSFHDKAVAQSYHEKSSICKTLDSHKKVRVMC